MRVTLPKQEPYNENRQIRLERRSPFYWRVTFDHPPLNIFGPETIPQLNEVITAIENDSLVKVVVFDSAVEGFFLTHYDFLAKPWLSPKQRQVCRLGQQACRRFQI
jgi:enoyl-CoA hydratase/carnithine racemase